MLFKIFLCFIVSVFGTSADRVLKSLTVTDWGDWGDWENCPLGMYVTGMQLLVQKHQGYFRDDRGLTVIRLFCNKFGQHNTHTAITSSTDTVGKWGNEYFCSGTMAGFQLRSEAYQTVFVDDTASNNVRIICGMNDTSVIEGDGTKSGHWTQSRLCEPREAVCGLRTQIDKSNSWDKTGLNNLMVKCCEIPHPVKVCIPSTTWKLVSTCNADSNDDKVCKYTRRIGVSYTTEVAQHTKQLNEKIGYDESHMKIQFQLKFHKYTNSTGQNEEQETWLRMPNYVWEREILVPAQTITPKNSKKFLYQIYGKCGMLQVWGTKIKKVERFMDSVGIDFKTVKYFDFTNNAAEVDLYTETI